MGNLLIALFGFVSFSVLARMYDSNDFAQWVLLISGGSLIEMIRYGISNNGLVRFLSQANDTEQENLIGSNAILSLGVTIIFMIALGSIAILFESSIQSTSYRLFFKWYPWLVVINLPMNNALVIQHAKLNFARILFIRFLNSTPFFIYLLLNYFFLQHTINQVVKVYVVIAGTTSLICMIRSWDGIDKLRYFHKPSISTLLNFGKYSTFTLLGTNLLRNVDVLILSISPFGSDAVTLFSIPLKLTEIQQIPLRSFAATAYPKLSKASLQNDYLRLKRIFNLYTGALTYLFFFGSIITFVFAKEFVILISGYQYLDSSVTGIDIVQIVKILSVYGVLLPFDRLTGICLDSINKPKINAMKVMAMLLLNIIGDLISIYVFESVEYVAVSTLVFTLAGILIGCYYLSFSFVISLKSIVVNTNHFIKVLSVNFFKNGRLEYNSMPVSKS